MKSIIIVCLLNLMAWKASWAHRTGENEKKQNDNDKIKSRSKRRAPVLRQGCRGELSIIMRKPAFCNLPKAMVHISSTVAQAGQKFCSMMQR